MKKAEIYNPGEEIRIIIHRERDPITVGWKAEKNGDLYGDYVQLDRSATEHDIAAAAGSLIEDALMTLRIVPDMEQKEMEK